MDMRNGRRLSAGIGGLLLGAVVLIMGTSGPIPAWYAARYHPDHYSETIVLLTGLPLLGTLFGIWPIAIVAVGCGVRAMLVDNANLGGLLSVAMALSGVVAFVAWLLLLW